MPRKNAVNYRKHVEKKHRVSVMLETHCFFCEKEVPKENKTLDHLLPIDSGGTNARLNLVMACWGCNHCKGNKHPVDFVIKHFNAKERSARLVDKINKRLVEFYNHLERIKRVA